QYLAPCRRHRQPCRPDKHEVLLPADRQQRTRDRAAETHPVPAGLHHDLRPQWKTHRLSPVPLIPRRFRADSLTVSKDRSRRLREVVIVPSPQPKSGPPDFGHSLTWRKSDISDFRWEKAARCFSAKNG